MLDECLKGFLISVYVRKYGYSHKPPRKTKSTPCPAAKSQGQPAGSGEVFTLPAWRETCQRCFGFENSAGSRWLTYTLSSVMIQEQKTPWSARLRLVRHTRSARLRLVRLGARLRRPTRSSRLRACPPRPERKAAPCPTPERKAAPCPVSTKQPEFSSHPQEFFLRSVSDCLCFQTVYDALRYGHCTSEWKSETDIFRKFGRRAPGMFPVSDFCHSDLFRISIFGFPRFREIRLALFSAISYDKQNRRCDYDRTYEQC